jgi:effector-binding domain-containing protein
MPSKVIRFAAMGLLAILVACGTTSVSFADEAAPAAPSTAQSPSSEQPQPPSVSQTPTAQTPASPAPATTPQPPPASGAAPPPGTSDGAKPGETNGPKAESATGETVELAQRPFAFIEGKADRDEVYSAIQGSLGLVKREMDKAGVKAAGRPLAVFIESDDTGFRYRAGYPLESAPEGKANVSEAVKIGVTPSGKAMRFQHLGAYADIDATYDAITAYLDEKGIDAQDSFVEEYVNDVKDADDPNLEVDIYVLLK